MRKTGIVGALVLFALSNVASAQPILYAVVQPPRIQAAGPSTYYLALPARLYSIDVATGASTSVTLGGTGCVVAAQPDASRIYTACNTSAGSKLTVLDPTGLTVLATAPLNDAPSAVRVSADGTKLVVSTSLDVEVFQAPSLTPVGVVGLSSAGAIAIVPDASRAYVTAPHAVVSIDLASPRLIKQLPVNVEVPQAIGLSSDGRTGVVSRQGTLAAVAILDTQTDAMTTSAAMTILQAIGSDIAVDAGGTRAYVPLSGTTLYAKDPAALGVKVFDIASGTFTGTLAVGASSRVELLPSGALAVSSYGGLDGPTTISIVDVSSGATASTIPLSGVVTQLDAAPPGAPMLSSNEPCTYSVSRLSSSIMSSALDHNLADPAGSTAQLGVVAVPDRCAWTAQVDGSWLTLAAYAGTGSAIVQLTVAPNATGVVRTGKVTVASSTFTVTQAGCSAPLVVIDTPQPNAVVRPPFQVAGWAIDRCAISGTGMWPAYSYPGASPQNYGYGSARPDVAAAYGSQFLNSGYSFLDMSESAGGPKTLHVSFLQNSSNGAAEATVNVNVLPSSRPFGVVDTPEDWATVAGDVPLTGWALDDIGLVGNISVGYIAGPPPADGSVPLGRMILGAATRVTGARPDVRAAYSTYPESDRAGFGVMMLTNALPNGGNGTFTFYVAVSDSVGTTFLNPRTIVVDNTHSVLPFGAIDTPTSGQTVSGTVAVQGWALTPGSATIAWDGSGIDIVVDSAVVGHPTYGTVRTDVQALFPTYTNSTAPGFYYQLDTTQLANGVHSIALVVRDGAGNAKGIGSRYFTVSNP